MKLSFYLRECAEGLWTLAGAVGFLLIFAACLGV